MNRKSSQGKRNKVTLPCFGKKLRDRREEVGESQAAIGEALGRDQSLITLLETGDITNPNLAMVQEIANAYKLNREQVVAWLVEEKYQVGATRASLLNLEVLNLDQLAAWEASLVSVPNLELCVVSAEFVDNNNLPMRAAIGALLKAKKTVRFFVKAADCEENGAFMMLQRTLASELGNEKTLKGYLYGHGLPPDKLRWVTSSFVIKNPRSTFEAGKSTERAEGYTIISLGEGKEYGPKYGFRMSSTELQSKAHSIRCWLEENGFWGKNEKL